MITKKELEEFAKVKKLNLGNTEKDYLLDHALLSISNNTKNELIFKGGTCLYKFYKLERFSEDLDFSCAIPINFDNLLKRMILDFKKFGITAEIHKKKEPFNTILATLKIKGPLFAGTSQSYASLGIDINFKSEVLRKPEVLSFSSIYPDIPPFSILCMTKEEIFAEKIRAILTRKKARDLFDLFFLINKNIAPDLNLIQKKLQYYNRSFELKEITKRIGELESLWTRELKGLAFSLPEFTKVKKETIKFIKERLAKQTGKNGDQL